MSGFTTSSAGTQAVIGNPVHPCAAAVIQELGGNTTGFAARQLTAGMASSADLILTMERGHRDDVLELSPQKLRRTFTLREAAILIMEYGAHQLADLATLRAHLGDKEPIDVPDPIGQDLTVFAQVGDRIASLIPPVLELCCRSSAANG